MQMLYNDDQTGLPRATRLHLPASVAGSTELWMGGARSGSGDDVHVDLLATSWVIDCAKDMPEAHLGAAAQTFYRVFIDTEDLPPNYQRIVSLAASIGASIQGRSPESEDSWEHPVEAPQRLYVMCTYGLNRSGLVMGRILRALGVPGDDAVAAIRSARPGALANLTYERIVRE